MGRNSGNF
jgi:hypothetical protein